MPTNSPVQYGAHYHQLSTPDKGLVDTHIANLKLIKYIANPDDTEAVKAAVEAAASPNGLLILKQHRAIEAASESASSPEGQEVLRQINAINKRTTTIEALDILDRDAYKDRIESYKLSSDTVKSHLGALKKIGYPGTERVKLPITPEEKGGKYKDRVNLMTSVTSPTGIKILRQRAVLNEAVKQHMITPPPDTVFTDDLAEWHIISLQKIKHPDVSDPEKLQETKEMLQKGVAKHVFFQLNTLDRAKHHGGNWFNTQPSGGQSR